ncbi:MAG: SpoIIE family protein phosphatase [Rhabdochlamydiaceae bacterium]
MSYFFFSSKLRQSIVLRVFFICAFFLFVPTFFYALYITIAEIEMPTHPLQHVLKHFMIFLLLLISVGGSLAVGLSLLMSKPLLHLEKVMKEIEQGDLYARYLPHSLGFEINHLGYGFNEAMNALIKEKIAKQILDHELKIGREIQKSLFPSFIPSVKGIKLGAHSYPAKQVGGDFYDVFTKENTLLITIGDASDKGVGPSLYSLSVRAMLRTLLHRDAAIEETVALTNHLFCQDTKPTSSFVTAWIGYYDLETKIMKYTNCGHPKSLIIRKGQILDLTTEGIPLGINTSFKPDIKSTILEEDDLLVLYTDGVLETPNKEGEMFGENRFLNILLSHHKQPPENLPDIILKEIKEFSQQIELFDDITFLFLKITR